MNWEPLPRYSDEGRRESRLHDVQRMVRRDLLDWLHHVLREGRRRAETLRRVLHCAQEGRGAHNEFGAAPDEYNKESLDKVNKTYKLISALLILREDCHNTHETWSIVT